MPTMDEKQAFLEQLDKCEPEAWKALMRFCLPKLTEEQELLAELVCREAERRAERASAGKATHYPADHLSDVLKDLDLMLTL